MKTQIIRVGNSRVILVPKLLLERTGLKDEVEIRVCDATLVIGAARRPRAGWASAFREMARRGDDILLDSPPAR